MDIQESRDDPPDFYRSKDNIFNYDWRDDLSQSQNTNTQDCRSSRDMVNFEREEEEDPRSLPKSPERYTSQCTDQYTDSNDQDNLTCLLDTVLEAQDKYISMFPNMGNLIHENETKSFEDITFCMLQQGLFLFDEYKKLNTRVNSDYLSILNKRLLSENDQLKKIKDQSSEIIKTLNENLCHRDKRIEEQLEHTNKNLPKGDVAKRVRREKDRNASVNKKLQFNSTRRKKPPSSRRYPSKLAIRISRSLENLY
ncbi:unnamed protein product [Moneuplotes crassus]|uniref:Uncharacterized protein n=1 Tax=Euplotes crassus TaxID=5936 RepID=A0AAD2D0V2_EUPCR|nr:unnamed protein product [Moneuplotes crassus]